MAENGHRRNTRPRREAAPIAPAPWGSQRQGCIRRISAQDALRGPQSPFIPRPPVGQATPRGEVPEWSIGTVSKTVVLARVPWVRIPPSPPFPFRDLPAPFRKARVFRWLSGPSLPPLPAACHSSPRRDGYDAGAPPEETGYRGRYAGGQAGEGGQAARDSHRLSDGGGLRLQVQPTDSRLWRYRYLFGRVDQPHRGPGGARHREGSASVGTGPQYREAHQPHRLDRPTPRLLREAVARAWHAQQAPGLDPATHG